MLFSMFHQTTCIPFSYLWFIFMYLVKYSNLIYLILENTEFKPTFTTDLEKWIDQYTEELPPLKNFILPVSSLYQVHTHNFLTIKY